MNQPKHAPDTPLPGDRSAPDRLAVLGEAHLEWLRERHYAAATLKNRHHGLWWFCWWCAERGLTQPAQITRPILERFQRWVFHWRTKADQPLSVRAQCARLIQVQRWFAWLTRQGYLAANPAADLELPRPGRRLPRGVLTPAEVERIFQAMDLSTPWGLRDRAMLETFYSTGMRRAELMRLRIADIDLQGGTVFIREGKGRADRVIPIGERACAWVDKYLQEVRPQLVSGTDAGVLFLTHWGEGFSPASLTQMVRKRVAAAGLGKAGSCHLFRHSCATAMLENGADVRYVQELLGHVQLSTTQIYTHVSIRQLKAIHTATHPARLHRKDEG